MSGHSYCNIQDICDEVHQGLLSQMTWFRWEGKDLILRLRIQPKASRDAFIGPYGEDAYKIAISAPPIDGKANARLIGFLAKQAGLPRSRVILESGETSRIKTLRLKSPKKLPLDLDEKKV